MTDEEWVGLPGMLAHEDFLHIMSSLDELGVVSRHRTITTAVGVEGAEHAYIVQVQPSDARHAACTLRDHWGIEDPTSETPAW